MSLINLVKKAIFFLLVVDSVVVGVDSVVVGSGVVDSAEKKL